MRLALLSAEYPPQPGGVGDYTRCLGLAMQARGLEVQILTSLPGAPGGDLLPRHALGAWDWGCWRRVGRLLRALDADLLHIQYQTGAYAMHPAINGLPLALRAQGLRLPVVVTCHDLRLPYLLPKATLLRRWVTARLLRDAEAVIVTNAEDAARLQAALPADAEHYAAPRPLAHTLIPIGSNIASLPLPAEQRAAWRARMGATGDAMLLGYFGLANRSKGIDLLLRALALLGPEYRLAIIGGEAGASDADNRRYAEELVALGQRLGVAERVWRSGQLEAAEVSAALQACDAAVLPFRDGASYRRGSLLAALAHGLPLISSAPPRALDPPLRDGREALLVAGVEATLPQQIADAARRVAEHPALRQQLAEAACRTAAAFSWEAIAAQHQQLYQTLVKE